MLHDGVAETHRAVERRPVVHLAGRIDRCPAVHRAPSADRVEVLERQPDRIHHLVARRAGRVLPVLGQPLAHRQRLLVLHVFHQRRHVAGRRRRRHAEQHFHHVFTAQHRRRPVGKRGERQDAGVAEQPDAIRIGDGDAPERAALYVGDAVMPRQHLVDERVVGGQQVDDAAVLAHDAVEEQLGLARHRLAEIAAVFREQAGVGIRCLHTAQPEPLLGEVVDQGGRTAVAEHPPDLALEYGGILQGAALGEREKPIVGAAAPQEI